MQMGILEVAAGGTFLIVVHEAFGATKG